MQYCGENDKPIVKYKFGTGGYRRFKSDYSPIEVDVKQAPVENTGEYESEGYELSFVSPNNSNRVLVYTVLDYKYIPLPEYGQDYGEMRMQQCGESKMAEFGPVCDPRTITINPNIHCPVAGKNKCSIQIQYNGSVIYQDQGDCLCEFEVQCGNCPSGYIECKTNKYPGYCCIPCQGTAAKIHNLANNIKIL